MKSINASIAAFCLLAFSGCSLFSGQQADYSKGATQMPALEIPPDLTRPVTVDTYKVPLAQVASDVPAISGTTATDVSMQVEESGVNSILIKDAFDRSWRRVGLALERLQLQLEDKDRNKGIYYLKPIAAGGLVAMPKEAGVAASVYRVQVKDNGMSCSVTVAAADGMSDDGSKVILDALYKNIQP